VFCDSGGADRGDFEMSRALPLFCACAFLCAAAPSFAQEVRSEVVWLADLNPSNEADADELIARIHDAAGRVCGRRTGVQPVAQWAADRDCQSETTEWAVKDFGHPVVLARYYGVTPRVIVEEEAGADAYYDEYVVVEKNQR
jgi:UrcA family protein